MLKTIGAIFIAGGVLYAMRQVPVASKVAEIITKGYGE